MAVDTRNKRMSLIGFGSPVPTVRPNPDGLTDADDRAMLLWLYAGISIAVTGATAGAQFKGMWRGMAKGMSR